MEERQVITINKNFICTFFFSFLTSFLILFIINHFGYFAKTDVFPAQFDSNGKLINVYDMPVQDDTLMELTYYSPLGSIVSDNKTVYTVKDGYLNGKVNTYFVKVQYYFRATIDKFVYVILIWIAAIIVIMFFKKFKISIK